MWWRSRWRPPVVDALLAVALAAVCILQGLDDELGRWRPFDLPAMVLSALATLPVAVRRRAPVAVLLTCYGFWVWQILLGYNPVVSTYGVLLAMYTVAATQPRRITAALLAVNPVIWIVTGFTTGFASPAGVLLTGLAVPAVIAKVGDSARRLAAANEARARQAVTEERLRIARELHDVVAHHMSVVAVQAGLARYVLRTDPPTAEAALSTVLSTSAEALGEMRRVLSLLRAGEEPEDDAPAPGLPGLLALIDRVRAAGVPVEMRITGEPRVLPPGLDLCVHRIVQEGLTNVLKHAAPATATVTVGYGHDQVEVTVRDDGAPTAGHRSPGGQGLIGMRERALLYGGTLTAAPRPGEGFEVRLTLPIPEGDRRAR
ncbi:sensor histidine kinase [Actinoplanes sp. TRM 88003]|uniref:histidine kinase n=1 Tax=Paractinoplanes aksuensis TaxID=2939490 RepID=A0ABT1DJ74_9ACTN|nr:sensor histidine kinase [Actinoplanes aksuensis]MCO8270523.1 sensor histidine kinase [Actinoplanes aksuensis]